MPIVVALALLTATPDVKRDTVARDGFGTLGMSAHLNALPFTGRAFDLGHAARGWGVVLSGSCGRSVEG
jgi:hypothetical protein